MTDHAGSLAVFATAPVRHIYLIDANGQVVFVQIGICIRLKISVWIIIHYKRIRIMALVTQGGIFGHIWVSPRPRDKQRLLGTGTASLSLGDQIKPIGYPINTWIGGT